MPARNRNASIEQLELFRPPPRRPRWRDLPEDVKAQVRTLMAQMLRTHVDGGTAGGGRQEVKDE